METSIVVILILYAYQLIHTAVELQISPYCHTEAKLLTNVLRSY